MDQEDNIDGPDMGHTAVYNTNEENTNTSTMTDNQ